MKKTSLLLVLFFATSLLFSQSNKKELTWNSFNDGIAKAKASNKKILIDVYTDWCKWCKKMDAEVYTDPKVKAYLNKNFVIIKLNAEGQGKIKYHDKEISPAEFAQGIGVSGYPATAFLQSDGEPITLLPGYSEASIFIHVLSFIGEDQYQKKKFDDYLKEKGVKQ